MMPRRTAGGEHLLRNTLAFLSFQIVQETNMTRDASPLRMDVFMPVTFAHQSSTDLSKNHRDVSNPVSWHDSMTKVHSLKENRHLKKRCGPLSCSLLHWGAKP